MRGTTRGTTRRFTGGRSSVVSIALAMVHLVPGPTLAQEGATVRLTDTIPAATLDSMILLGSERFNDGSCLFCHAVGGRGDGRRGPDLTDVEWLHSDGSFEGVLETITWGVRKNEIKAVAPRPFEMFPVGGMSLSFEERQAIAAYVWSLAHGRQPDSIVAQN